MKKILLFAFAICTTLALNAEPYGIIVNGNKFLQGSPNPSPVDPSFKEYMVLGASIKSGDKLQLHDQGTGASWAVPLDKASSAKIVLTNGNYVCNETGCYDFYIKLQYENDQLYIGEATGDCGGGDNPGPNPNPNPNPTYSTSVPSKCEDVILQAFYWDSNQDGKGHGNTKWSTLNGIAGEIAANFDLVWLPPSAKSSGGVGYHPRQYSNQNSDWGTAAELQKFIATMHTSGTKVIADIVINHADQKSNWCDYLVMDFGEYGKFTPDASWICKTDEVNSNPEAGACFGKATGSNDDGYGSEANYAAARDWDHNSEKVRQMFRAYLKWMKNVMHYDGWRYDYCKGFHGSHINDYNSAAGAYFSVTEMWDGNSTVLQNYLNDCNWNTLTFDFATKYEALNRGIAAGNYAGCKGAGLLGAGKSKYAVTFVDSHDSYQRDDNEFGGKGNSMKLKDKLLQANAYILSMPGVPCVFYPHWKEFKTDINKMVEARHLARIHSESSVEDDTNNGGYHAKVYGEGNGELQLFLNQASSCPAGYKEIAKGNGWAIYVKAASGAKQKLIVSPGSGTYTEKVDVEMSMVGGGEIYYTTDGSTPSKTSKKYAGKFTLTQTTIVKAIGYNATGNSDVVTVEYTVKPRQTWPITIKFYNSGNWAKVYAYAWTEEGDLLGKWPGTQLVAGADGWFAHTFDASVKGTNFIFNGGLSQPQTGDLYTEEDVCYSWNGDNEVLEPTCTYTAIENVLNDNSLVIYPNPTKGIVYISSTTDIERIEIYSCMGALVSSQTVGATSETLDVSDLSNGMYIIRTTLTNNKIATSKFVKQ